MHPFNSFYRAVKHNKAAGQAGGTGFSSGLLGSESVWAILKPCVLALVNLCFSEVTAHRTEFPP